MKLPAGSSSWTHIIFAACTRASLKAWSELTELPQPDREALRALIASLRTSIDSLLEEARETHDVTIFGRPEAQTRQNAWLTLLKRVASGSLAFGLCPAWPGR